ncbi:hypothetical protein OIU91_19900 [Streptomyces sp. NBC_01456]|uniref:hypothetical protein n=1 Tax=Streptomyces sp. NBC_01456 TaxID=2975868 RepID=UPI002E37018A|nr:hypothetical protein [Streptomyces sp. NBC_01456]
MIYTPPDPWPPEPEPRAGCDRCLDLDEQRTAARRRGDISAVSDCNVLLRQHIREAHP